MRTLNAALAVTFAMAGGVTTVWAQQTAPRSVTEGIYTTEQAARGEAVYDEQCALCHGKMTAFTPDMAPLLGDHTFRARWTDRSLGELFGMIHETMPQDAPGTLSSQESADLVAYILSGNRLPAGDVPLTDDLETLTQTPFDPGQ